MKLFITFLLVVISLFTISCNKKDRLPESETLQQKLLRCVYSDITLPKEYWVLLSGSEISLMDFIVLKPFSKDSITVLSCKVAIADTSYIDNKNEFFGNCLITNDITSEEAKVFFTSILKKNVSKQTIQLNQLLRQIKRAGNIRCYGRFDPKIIGLIECRNGKLKKISICKDSQHPLNTLFENIIKIL